MRSLCSTPWEDILATRSDKEHATRVRELTREIEAVLEGQSVGDVESVQSELRSLRAQGMTRSRYNLESPFRRARD